MKEQNKIISELIMMFSVLGFGLGLFATIIYDIFGWIIALLFVMVIAVGITFIAEIIRREFKIKVI